MGVEEEKRELKSFFDLVRAKAELYLDFITNKGLFNEFDEWRRKKIFEI